MHPTLRVTTTVRNETVSKDGTLLLEANPLFGDHSTTGEHPRHRATKDSFAGTGMGKGSKGSGAEMWLRDVEELRGAMTKSRARRGGR